MKSFLREETTRKHVPRRSSEEERKDPNARCRTFFSAVGADIVSGSKGEEREKNCRKTAEEEWPDPVIHLDCMFMRDESET